MSGRRCSPRTNLNKNKTTQSALNLWTYNSCITAGRDMLYLNGVFDRPTSSIRNLKKKLLKEHFFILKVFIRQEI